MTDEHKQKLREARYQRIYGDRWQEAMALRDEQRVIEKDKIKGRVKELANGEGLSKSEFLRLVAARMRLWTAKPKEFLALAKLYAEVKRWTEPLPEPTTRKETELSAGDLIAQLETLTRDEGESDE